jgi:hypothetical protein
MAKKDCTLFGFIGQVCKDLSDNMKEDGGTIPTTEDVKSLVSEIVTETYIHSLSAKVDAPTIETIDGATYVFANGTPVTIEAREDGEDGAIIKWNGGEEVVTPNTNVFGGRHDDDTYTNSNITVNGGYVNNVVGGGLHKSHTVSATIHMNGGKVKGINGGGCSSLTKKCGCENATTWYAGDPKESPCVTEEANIVLLGGTSTSLVFGGGEGISYTKKASITVGGTFEAYYLTVGGSNGETTVGSVVVNGGKIKVLQGINRGNMEQINIVVNGGKIESAYAGGEVPFVGTSEKPNGNDASGSFTKSTMEINGGTITTLSLGGNNYQAIEEGTEEANAVTLVDNRK